MTPDMRVTTGHLDDAAATAVTAQSSVAAAATSSPVVAAGAGLRPTGVAFAAYVAAVSRVSGQIEAALGELTADTESSSGAYTTTDSDSADNVTRSV